MLVPRNPASLLLPAFRHVYFFAYPQTHGRSVFSCKMYHTPKCRDYSRSESEPSSDYSSSDDNTRQTDLRSVCAFISDIYLTVLKCLASQSRAVSPWIQRGRKGWRILTTPRQSGLFCSLFTEAFSSTRRHLNPPNPGSPAQIVFKGWKRKGEEEGESIAVRPTADAINPSETNSSLLYPAVSSPRAPRTRRVRH